MYRQNHTNRQETLIDISAWMDKRTLKKLNESWAPIFYNEVFKKIDEEPFSVLYSETGAPNFPVNILLSLEYIKYMKHYNDLDLLEGYDFDYLINYAVGNKTLGEKPLSERTLYNFRSRVYKYSMDNPGSDGILYGQFINLLGNFAEKSHISMKEQRMDTTMFMSNIKRAGRLTLAYDMLVKAVKAIPEDMRTDALAAALKPEFKTDTLYRTKPDGNSSKLDQLMALCKETYEILKGIPEAAETTVNMRRFLKEQSEVDINGRTRAKSKYAIRADSIQSAFDTDATYHKKSGAGQSGYVMELSETCADENPYNLLTDCRVEKNIVSDVKIIADRIAVINDNTGCENMYVDGGFNSVSASNAAEAAGVELHMTNMSGTRPTEKMPAEVYEIDEETNRILKCPEGATPIHASITGSQTVAHFDKNICEQCEMYGRCHAKLQKNSAVLRISLKSVRTGRERTKMISERVGNTSKRAAIEGSNSAMKRTGLRKLKVRGQEKCGVVALFMATSQNIKRFINYKLNRYDAAIRKKKERIGQDLPSFT